MDSQRFGYFFFCFAISFLFDLWRRFRKVQSFSLFAFFFWSTLIWDCVLDQSLGSSYSWWFWFDFSFFESFRHVGGEGNVEIKVFDWINKTKETLTIWLFSFRRLVNISIFEFYLAQIIVPKEPIEFPISFKFDEIWLKFENNSVRNSFDCRKFYRKQILFF